MPRGRSSSGSVSFQGRGFTYNFGIAIASRTVNQLGLLNRSTLSLAGALYGLSRITSEYTDTLKKNTLAFGGQLKTINAMQFAQKQLLSGATEFATGDIMDGMRTLMSAGLDARKNFQFMSDAAQATGNSFSQFAGAVHQAIAGNMSGLVQMGLMTERATRNFDRYYANTVTRQRVIMNFLKSNKNLQLAISQSFHTISGQWKRIIENVRMFAQALIGNPQDPNSFYQHIVRLVKSVADFLHKHSLQIRKAGAAIGMVLSWIVKQIEFFIKFIGRQFEKALVWIDQHLGNFKERMFSLILWLELWKVHIVGWIKEHKTQLLDLLKLYLAFKGIQLVTRAFTSLSTQLEFVLFLLRGIPGAGRLLYRFGRMKFFTPLVSQAKQLLLYIGALPKALKTVWRFMRFQGLGKSAFQIFKNLPLLLGRGVLGLLRMIPLWGWIIAAVFLIWKNWDKIVATMKPLINDLLDMASMLWKEIQPALESIWDLFNAIGDALGPILLVGLKIFVFLLRVSLKIIGFILKVTLRLAVVLLKTVVGAIRWVIGALKTAWNWVVDIGKAFVNWIPQPVKDGINWVVDKVQWLWDKVMGIWDAIKSVGNWFSSEPAKTNVSVPALYTPVTGAGGFSNPFAGQDLFKKPQLPVAPSTEPTEPMDHPRKRRGFKNPLYDDNSVADTRNVGDFGGGTVSIGSGAVQINIQKGQNIDEYKLKALVEQALNDIVRKNKLTQGK